MANEYTALDSIQAPGTTVFGYRRGDAVGADVVENWGLVVGEPGNAEAQVCEGDLPDDAAVEPVAARPGPEATHADWQAWAVANGMSEADAENATIEDLQAVEQQPAAADTAVTDAERPADSAKKAEWVAYAEKRGADPAWAEADSTTKADLQAWQPEQGDYVAEAATEAQQG